MQLYHWSVINTLVWLACKLSRYTGQIRSEAFNNVRMKCLKLDVLFCFIVGFRYYWSLFLRI